MYVGCPIHLNIFFCLVTSLPTKVWIHGTSYYVIFYSLLFPVTLVQIELLISKGIAMWGWGVWPHMETSLNSWESYHLYHSTFFLFFYLWWRIRFILQQIMTVIMYKLSKVKIFIFHLPLYPYTNKVLIFQVSNFLTNCH
jgi:hypothetical protein